MASPDDILLQFTLGDIGVLEFLNKLDSHLDKVDASTKSVNETVKKNTNVSKENIAAIKEKIALQKLEEQTARAATAQINQKTAAMRNFSAAARSSGGTSTNASPAFLSGGQKDAKLRNFQAGNAAMQVQDIAVSLQGGMSGLQVMGQQGSQLLSIFGTKGMLVGGIVAVGAAIGTAIHDGQKAFESFLVEAEAVSSELSKIAEFGSGGELFTGAGKAAEQLKNIAKAKSDSQGMFATGFANLSRFAGGDTAFERIAKLNEKNTMTEIERRDIAVAIVKEMEREAEIVQMVADGETEAADAAKRLLDYERKVNKIKASEMPDEQKTAAIGVAESEWAAKEKIAHNEQVAERKKKIDKHLQDQVDANTKKAEKDMAEFARKQEQYLRDHAKQVADIAKEKERINKSVSDLLDGIQEDENKEIARNKRKRMDAEEQAKKNTEATKLQRDKVAILEAEITSGKDAADALAKKLDLERNILQARKDGNKEIVAQLVNEKRLLGRKDAIDEELKTPQQKKAERDEKKKRKKAARIVESRERRKAQAAAAAGFGGFVPDGGGKAAGVPDMQPNAAAGAAAAANGGNQMKVDTLVVKTLKHG